MSKRGGGNGESYTNGGWSNEPEIPSYMTNTPPASNGFFPDTTKPKPGRIKRQRPQINTKQKKTSIIQQFHYKWITGFTNTYVSLYVAIFSWYLLGVLSIGTTKVLLQDGAPPLWLTLQQLVLGSNLLNFLLQLKSLGSAGLQPWPTPSQESPIRRMQRQQNEKRRYVCQSLYYTLLSKKIHSHRHTYSHTCRSSFLSSFPTKDLVLAGAFFCFGFLATNYSFQKSSAAFVETIKAAEPITSAGTAVAWGIETLSSSEVMSLAVVVLGVLMSTLGNGHGDKGSATLTDNIRACAIVMTANLCFSFRGLHQKMFRATSIGNANLIDDMNLQYRMQQIGVYILVVPVLIWDAPSLLTSLWNGVGFDEGMRYLGLALINGFAFTTYK